MTTKLKPCSAAFSASSASLPLRVSKLSQRLRYFANFLLRICKFSVESWRFRNIFVTLRYNDKRMRSNVMEGFLSSRKLRERGDYYKARRSVAIGNLVKVRHGVYADPESLVSNMVDVETVIPGGLVCMYSAWSYYGLTTTISPAICVAVKASRKVVIPEVIPFEIYYWKEEYLMIGSAECEYSGYKVRITDIERSVCDALRYRNKIGVDLCSEILTNYLKRNDRNLTKLSEYAGKLRVRRVLANYLELYLQ